MKGRIRISPHTRAANAMADRRRRNHSPDAGKMVDPMKYDADKTYHKGDVIRWAGKLMTFNGRQFVEHTDPA